MVGSERPYTRVQQLDILVRGAGRVSGQALPVGMVMAGGQRSRVIGAQHTQRIRQEPPVRRSGSGGITAEMRRLSIGTRDGGTRHLVLRTFVDEEHAEDWLNREAGALTLLAGTCVPAPGLVAVDPTAVHCEYPSLLMTHLAGRTVLDDEGLEPQPRASGCTGGCGTGWRSQKTCGCCRRHGGRWGGQS